jgi:hypothetical protein
MEKIKAVSSRNEKPEERSVMIELNLPQTSKNKFSVDRLYVIRYYNGTNGCVVCSTDIFRSGGLSSDEHSFYRGVTNPSKSHKWNLVSLALQEDSRLRLITTDETANKFHCAVTEQLTKLLKDLNE